MQKERTLGYATPALLVVVLLLVLLVMFQLHNLEQRFITQGHQLRALGEATDKLLAGGVRVASGPAAGGPPNVKLLHPEVENFLGERKTHWPPEGAAMDGVLLRGWSSGDPKGFNPLIENAGELSELIETYAGMQVAMRNGWTDPDTWHDDLAWRVEVIDDYKEFTIYLKKGMKWHLPPNLDTNSPRYAWLRGDHPVTAHDLAFTFDMILNPQVENGFLKNYYAELDTWKAIDDHTFVARWKKKQFTNVSMTLEIYPIPKFLYAHEEDGTPIAEESLGLRFNQHWYNNKGYVGSGPYRMTAYKPGAEIRLARNSDYAGPAPAIKELRYPIYTDPAQTLLKLKAHELSVGGLTPGQYRDEIQQYEQSGKKPVKSPFFDGRIACERITHPVFSYVGWNADNPLFADKRVRRAMTHAFNRQQIIESVFAGLGKIATSPFLPGSPGNDPAIQPYPFDLEKARQLLAEAGWADSNGDGVLEKKLKPSDKQPTPFAFSLLIYGTSKEYASLANILKEDLLKVGVQMKIDAAEWSLMQKRMEEKNFDAYTGAWGLVWDTDLFQIWHSSQADLPKGSNRVGFRNSEADKIIEALRAEFDPAKRVELLRSFHRLVHDEQPYSFFQNPLSVYCRWNDVQNVIYSKVRPVTNSLPWSVQVGG